MDESRTRVLSAVRSALGLRTLDARVVRAEADALLHDVAGARPALSAPELLDAFIARATSAKVAATVERVATPADWPQAVRHYVDAQGLASAIALQPSAALRALDWAGLACHETLAADEAVAVTEARLGIAETGSVVFESGPESPVLHHFLPQHEVVLLRASAIVAYLEDYAASAAGRPAPRNVNIVTGASGTTDIEGRLVLGAHGPQRLHIVIALAD